MARKLKMNMLKCWITVPFEPLMPEDESSERQAFGDDSLNGSTLGASSSVEVTEDGGEGVLFWFRFTIE